MLIGMRFINYITTIRVYKPKIIVKKMVIRSRKILQLKQSFIYKGQLSSVLSDLYYQKNWEELNETPAAGHSGYHKAFAGFKVGFYWPGMRKYIRNFIGECATCKRNKAENVIDRVRTNISKVYP